MNINNNPGEQGNSRPIKDIIEEYFQTTPNSENMKDFQQGIAACIESFVNSPCITSNFKLDQLSYQFKNSVVPEKPLMSTAYIQYLKEKVLPHSVNVGNRQYIGHMTSQLPLFFQYISQLITLMNQNVVKVETSKVYTLIERQTIAMLHRLVYELPDSFYNENVQKRESNLGIITSCGTLANITALWIARNSALQSSDEFLGLQSEGFVNALKHYGYKDAVIIGSAKMHYSMDKLGSLIGLGAENIIKIGLNKNGAININKLKRAILECKREKRLVVAIVGIAGATETGQIDDLVAMAEASLEHDIHFHVDAAWGGPILFSEKNKHLLDGIDKADTVTICGHKQLYLPQGISVILCKDPKIINHIKATARYQARSESYDLGKHSPEGSRPAVCAHLHAGLHMLGKEGYAYLIDEGIRKAAYFAGLIDSHKAFELMSEPNSNIVVYRYIPEEMRNKIETGSFSREDHYVIDSINEVLQDEQFSMGHSFVSRTTLVHSRYGSKLPLVVLRVVLANPLTTDADLKAVLENQVTVGDIIFKQRSMSFAQMLKLLFHQTSSFDRQ